MQFTIRVYVETAAFPKAEIFGLTSQLRRAAVAIPLNLAERAGSGSDMEFKRLLRISQRSCYEVISGVEIGRGLTNLTNQVSDDLGQEAEEIVAMIGALIRYLSKPKPTQANPTAKQTDD